MITGFNTDIEFGGVTYHVQTEDKGTTKPLILSLVYDRGTILASKRSSYEDLVAAGLDEKVLAERLQKQHTLICAAVRSGRIEDLKQMTLREAAKAKQAASVAVPAVDPIAKPADSFASVATFAPPALDIPIPRPGMGGAGQPNSAPFFAEPFFGAIELSDEDLMLPGDAVQVITEPAKGGSEAANKLSIEFLGESSFKGGDKKSVGFMVCRGHGRKVVREAQIMVKILGSSFKPLIFHARTDINGIARVNVQLPNFNSGRSVFLVRAISNGEEVEVRRPIAHG